MKTGAIAVNKFDIAIFYILMTFFRFVVSIMQW